MGKKSNSGKKRKGNKGSGLFRPAKNKEISKIVRIDSPKGAKESVSMLRKLLDAGKITIDECIKFVTCAANRATVSLRRKNLSKKERKEMKKVAEIYNDFKEDLKKAKKILGLR